MIYILVILIVIIMILVGSNMILRSQIRNISKQLDKRFHEHTLSPISLELINTDLNQLAMKINQCLKAEETLRLNGFREERKFKELIADISHDLRTPLTAIKGYQQIIDKGELNVEQKMKLQIAMKHADELGQLIEQFFEYSYLLNTEQKLILEYFNLTNLVTESIITFITALEEKGLTISFDDIPAIYITSDKGKVMRIVHNLIRNCIQHSDGDIKVQLLLDKDVTIAFQNPVRNSEDIEVSRIFERFYTGDRARSHSTGLGLSIVKLLAEQMDGNVDAYLEDGQLEIRVKLHDLFH